MLVEKALGHFSGNPVLISARSQIKKTQRDREEAERQRIAAISGQLAIDATPWGVVNEIRNQDGTLIALNGETQTPFVQTLVEGTYTVTLTVTDPAGETSTDTTTCTVLPPLPKPPTADANGPYQGRTHETIQFYSTGSTDPDGEIQEYLWDFGDGQLSTDSSPIHLYLYEDTYVVSLTVTRRVLSKWQILHQLI